MRISYVNGEYVDHDKATVHIEDRGNVFSDGVYEVAIVKAGVFIDWDEHCTRLQYSLDGLKIEYKVDSSELKEIVHNLLEKNNLSDATLYLQITRGVAKRDHAFPVPTPKPTMFMMVSPLKMPSDEIYKNGAKAITTEDLRWKRRDFKTISLLPNILAKQEAVEAGAAEAILIDGDVVTEGSSTNFFIVNKDGKLQTHPANESILGGITRAGILKVAKEKGVEVVEKPFTTDEMFTAKEAFISSTTKHVFPIVNIDGKDIGNGKVGEVTEKLIDGYKAYIEAQTNE